MLASLGRIAASQRNTIFAVAAAGRAQQAAALLLWHCAAMLEATVNFLNGDGKQCVALLHVRCSTVSEPQPIVSSGRIASRTAAAGPTSAASCLVMWWTHRGLSWQSPGWAMTSWAWSPTGLQLQLPSKPLGAAAAAGASTAVMRGSVVRAVVWWQQLRSETGHGDLPLAAALRLSSVPVTRCDCRLGL